MNCLKYILGITMLLAAGGVKAQNDNHACLNEVIRYEEANSFRNDTSIGQKNIELSYSVRVTNWDDATTISNVKMHLMGDNMHFFSEQADIYRDDKEAVIIMPIQKVLIINSTSKELNNQRLGDEFFEMRKGFLDSCDIVKCEAHGANKILVLKADPKKLPPSVLIDNMTYEYSSELKKILSVKINYRRSYKIKQMLITYKDFNVASNYKFLPLRKYVIDKHGKLLSRYKGYEVVDNRDKGKSKSK